VVDGVPLIAVSATVEDSLWDRGGRIADLPGAVILGEQPSVLRKALVVSQGCDLVKSSFPCATVVPVYDAATALTPQQIGNAKAGKVWHLVPLTAPWTSGGIWVADLRLELPLDKSVLIGRDPIEGFKDEVDYLRLAERLALVRRRPDVPEPCLEHVVKPLQASLARYREDGLDVTSGVRELRVQANDHSKPTAVTLWVIRDDERDLDESVWDEVVQPVREHALANGIALAGPEIASLWEMAAADYITSDAIDDAESS
jgi:hypothetical protein